MAAATVACAIGFLIFFPWRLADALQVDFDGQSGYGEVRQSVFVKIAVGKHIFMRRKRVCPIKQHRLRNEALWAPLPLSNPRYFINRRIQILFVALRCYVAASS